jgi:hypothetical protein
MTCEQCHGWGVVLFPGEPPIWCRCAAGRRREQQALNEIACKIRRTMSVLALITGLAGRPAR